MIIEKQIRDYLSTALSVPVYIEVPRNPESSYVSIQRTGSQGANRLRTATLAIQSIAETLYDAAVLNESVRTALDGASIEDVFRIELDSDYNFTDETTKKRRYQAVYKITYKE